jgi:hypothetical protein
MTDLTPLIAVLSRIDDTLVCLLIAVSVLVGVMSTKR